MNLIWVAIVCICKLLRPILARSMFALFLGGIIGILIGKKLKK